MDRLSADPGLGVDVIIPVLHTNELWRANLLSIYREIPVNRLLLGDGGCIDDTIEIARKFPRVEVFDHRSFKSLGFSIRRLIEEVQTEWFIYLHSDVYLPEGWFNDMAAARNKYDWFESGQNVTVMVEYVPPTLEVERAYSGSQMGRKAAFKDVLPKIDDDYLYRNEDIIFANLIKDAGFRYGKVAETSHDHQVMFKESRWLRRVKRACVRAGALARRGGSSGANLCLRHRQVPPSGSRRGSDPGIARQPLQARAAQGGRLERVRALGRKDKSRVVRRFSRSHRRRRCPNVRVATGAGGSGASPSSCRRCRVGAAVAHSAAESAGSAPVERVDPEHPPHQPGTGRMPAVAGRNCADAACLRSRSLNTSPRASAALSSMCSAAPTFRSADTSDRAAICAERGRRHGDPRASKRARRRRP